MRAAALILTVCLLQWSHGCEPEQRHHGCRVNMSICSCGYGCKSDYIYKTKASCLNALNALNAARESSSNACIRKPCARGSCIQTTQEPGFACKCEGTGFYGQRCEKACPTVPMRGLVFPHECIVI